MSAWAWANSFREHYAPSPAPTVLGEGHPHTLTLAHPHTPTLPHPHTPSLPRRIAALHLFDVAPQALVFVGHVVEFEHVLDPLGQLDAVDRLAEEVIGAGFHGPFDVAGLVEGRDH